MGSAEQRFLTFEQLHALADAAGAHRPLGYVLGTCGLRFGKVAELRWRDLDLHKKQIRIARSVTLVDEVFKIGSPKNGKGCTVSLPAFVAELLRVQGVERTSNFTSIPGEPDALVFPDSEGGHMRVNNVRRPWWSQAVAAGANHGVRLQSPRAAAHHRVAGGSRPTPISRRCKNVLGHESAGLTLDRYGHLYGSDVEAVGKCGHGRYYNCS